MKSSSKTLHSRGRPHMRVGAYIIARRYTYQAIQQTLRGQTATYPG